MQLRPLDREGLDAYLDEIRPRFLTLHVDAGRVSFRWLVPSWAVEEPLRFALRAFALAFALAPGAMHALSRRAGRTGAHAPFLVPTRADLAHPVGWWDAFDQLFSEADRDLLALPDRLALVEVETGEVRVRIAETRF